jgi:Arc/MetJ-type ribon-helix-helix transcriptional regulator
MNTLIHIRLEPTLKKEIDNIVASGYCGTTTEFVKEQIRKGIFEHQKQSAFAKFRGISKERPSLTIEERTKIADYALAHPNEIFKKFGWKVSESTKKYQKKHDH